MNYSYLYLKLNNILQSKITISCTAFLCLLCVEFQNKFMNKIFCYKKYINYTIFQVISENIELELLKSAYNPIEYYLFMSIIVVPCFVAHKEYYIYYHILFIVIIVKFYMIFTISSNQIYPEICYQKIDLWMIFVSIILLFISIISLLFYVKHQREGYK